MVVKWFTSFFSDKYINIDSVNHELLLLMSDLQDYKTKLSSSSNTKRVQYRDAYNRRIEYLIVEFDKVILKIEEFSKKDKTLVEKLGKFNDAKRFLVGSKLEVFNLVGIEHSMKEINLLNELLNFYSKDITIGFKLCCN